MKNRIVRAFTIVSLAASLTGCAALGRTVGSVLKLPASVLKMGTRTISSIGG